MNKDDSFPTKNIRKTEDEIREMPDVQRYAKLLKAAPELLLCLRGMVAIHDSVTQGQERELRDEWLPKSRTLLKQLEDC